MDNKNKNESTGQASAASGVPEPTTNDILMSILREMRISNKQLIEKQELLVEANNKVIDCISKDKEDILENYQVICDEIKELKVAKINTGDNSITGQNVHENCGLSDQGQLALAYLTRWRELRGDLITFMPGGSVHPVAFIEKLSETFQEALVPQDKEVKLALSALRGSSVEYFDIHKRKLNSFRDFKRLFLDKYWGLEIQREVYRKIQFGSYVQGSREEYFIKLVKEARYLNPPLEDEEILELISGHFDLETQKGLLSISSIDQVEKYLRRLDRHDSMENRREGSNSFSNHNSGNCGNRSGDWRSHQQRAYDNSENAPSTRPGNRYDQNQSSQRIQTGARGNRDSSPHRESGPNQRVRQVNFVASVPDNCDHEKSQLEVDKPGSTVGTIFNKGGDDLLDESKEIVSQPVKLPSIRVQIEGLEVEALVDTGSQICCVSKKLFDCLLQINSQLPRLPFRGISIMGAFKNKALSVTEQVYLTFRVKKVEFSTVCIVIPGLIRDLIFGCDWMKSYQVKVDVGSSLVVGVFQGEAEQIPFSDCNGVSVCVSMTEIVDNEETSPVSKSRRSHYSEEAIRSQANNAESLDTKQKQALQELLLNFKQVWSDQPGLTDKYEHEIHLHDYSPFCVKSYPIPHAFRNEVDRQIKEMIEWGVIAPQQTEYVSPLVTVKKPDGSVRVCLDARHLNARMVKDHVIPGNPNEFLFRFSANQCLSTLDCTASYWQIPIRQQDQKYTGFLYQGLTYVFKVLPFGLSTSVGSFIRGLTKILGEEVNDFVVPYVDDLLVFSSDPDEHLSHLEILFKKFLNAGFTLKLRKCHFAKREVRFLGHILTPRGVSMDQDRIKAINQFPIPRNPKQLRGFLGLTNYERRFCEKYAELAFPLYKLLKKGQKWVWGSEEHEAFEKVKAAFLAVSFQEHPNPELRYFVQTDASAYGISGCLFQMKENSDSRSEKRIIAFFSRTLKGAELSYSVTEKEALAVVSALRHWRVFLIGQPLTIVTDHQALSFLQRCRLVNNRLTRWILFLQEFIFDIQYCPGKDNLLADLLSRYPIGSEEVPVSDPTSVTVAVQKLGGLSRRLMEKFKSIGLAQKNDPFCCKIKEELYSEIGKDSVKKWFLDYKGIIFKKGTPESPSARLCIPAEWTREIVIQEHEDQGHFGSAKCMAYLSQYYFWPRMRRQIRQITSSCELCQKSKISNHCHGKMQNVMATDPNDIVCLDLMGPLPTSRGGATQLLVVVDAFSKLVRLFPLKRATRGSILKCLTDKYFVELGRPRMILSDNGTQFQGSGWKNALKDIGIQVVNTSVYYPQGNMTERVNREIGRILRAYCFAKHTKWAFMTKQIETWLNNAIHESTGFSPRELHGLSSRQNQFIQDIPYPEVPEVYPHPIVFLARERLERKAARRKMKHDRRHVSVSFHIGDKVLVRTHPLSSAENKEIRKFFLLFRGPCTIVGNPHPNAYEVVEDITQEKLGVQNVYNLKPYRQPLQAMSVITLPVMPLLI